MFFEVTITGSIQAETVDEARRMFLISPRKLAEISETDIYGEPNGNNWQVYFKVTTDGQ